MAVITNLDLLKIRRTRLIATLGPSSQSPQQIQALIAAGVNVFRLNMSHGKRDFHSRCVEHIRRIAAEEGRVVGIMADLCGPKIRIGQFQQGEIDLQQGSRVCVTTRKVMGEEGLIPSQYADLARDVAVGDHILLDDGRKKLQVEEVSSTEIYCNVIQGGRLVDFKGINLPGVDLSVPSLTEKDRADVLFVLSLEVDFLALSFVRKAADIEELRALVHSVDERGKDNTPWIIAKIEKPEALENTNDILAAADGIMVARGDLGVELGAEQVPIAQLQLIQKARTNCKPVIVATQMLESMIENSSPTRAEVSDVANAVIMGADAVMLSGETAVGKYSLESVQMMDRIARMTETHLWHQGEFVLHPFDTTEQPTASAMPVWHAVANATAILSRSLQVRAIVAYSKSGISAATMSAARPYAPLLAVSEYVMVCRRMILLWGVLPLWAESGIAEDEKKFIREQVVSLELAQSGQNVLLVRGFHADPQHNAPSVTVVTV